MTYRTFTATTLDGKQLIVTTSHDQSYDDFVAALCDKQGIDQSFTLLLISDRQTIDRNNFDSLSDGSTILCVEARRTVAATDTMMRGDDSNNSANNKIGPSYVAEAPTDAVLSEPAPETALIEPAPETKTETQRVTTSTETLPYRYTLEQTIRAFVVFLEFFRRSPQIMALFNSDFDELRRLLLSDQELRTQLGVIIEQTTQISGSMEAVERGEMIRNNSGDLVITRHDHETILELIEMGFDDNEVVVAYLKSGKNKDKTLESLMSRST